jgi:hypothetical protein
MIPAPQIGNAGAPLAKLFAFQWFIRTGLVDAFREEREKVKIAYETHTKTIKTVYSQRHKRKRRALRKHFEQEVRSERFHSTSSESSTEIEPLLKKRRGGRDAFLTQKERRIVNERIQREEVAKRIRDRAIRKRNRKKNRQPLPHEPVEISTIIHELPPLIDDAEDEDDETKVDTKPKE